MPTHMIISSVCPLRYQDLLGKKSSILGTELQCLSLHTHTHTNTYACYNHYNHPLGKAYLLLLKYVFVGSYTVIEFTYKKYTKIYT